MQKCIFPMEGWGELQQFSPPPFSATQASLGIFFFFGGGGKKFARFATLKSLATPLNCEKPAIFFSKKTINTYLKY